MKKISTSREVQRAVEKAMSEGWRWRPARDGIVIYPPDGVTRPIAVHNKRRGRGKIEHAVEQMKKAGLDLE